MAVLDAIAGEGGAGGQFNARLSEDLQLYEVDYWPPDDDSAMSEVFSAEVDTHFPVTTTAREIDAEFAWSYFMDFYHRIHIRPKVLALGNLVSTQVETVEVWNAFLEAVELTTIDGVEEGVSLDGPDSFPLTFQALELVTWDVSITPDGPSTIDLTLTWDFDVVHDVSLHVTGARVVAFTPVPNWDSRIRERLTFLTDVLQSPSGAEQRRALRLSPRRRFEADLVVDGRERCLFDNATAGWGGRIWAMPVWPDIQLLAAGVVAGATSISCSTTGRDFRVGGLVLLRGESAFLSEAAEVEAFDGASITLKRPLQASWPAGTRLYPARTARMPSQPAVTRHTDTAWTAQIAFELMEPSDWPALAGLPTYRGHPVYAVRPDESADLAVTTERLIELLDNDSGLPASTDTAGQPFPVRAHRAVLKGVTERSDFRSLQYLLNGRQVSVWLPTHADDMRLTGTVGSSVTALPIERIGYARYGLGQVGRRDIRIELHSGTIYHRRITDASEVDADHEQIVIDSALGATVTPADVARISFMSLMRSNSDEFEILHETDVEGAAIAEIEFRAIRDELVDP